MFNNKDWNGSAAVEQHNLLCDACGAPLGKHFGQECPEVLPSISPGAVRYVKNEPAKPVHRIGVSFIAAVPDGAKLMAFNDQIFLVAPSMPPCFVTPTGLVPMQHADGSKEPT